MSLFKNYKALYESELNNRKMYEKRYREVEKKYRDLQQNKGVGDLRKQLMYLKDTNYELKAQVAQLKFDVEDLKGFLAQETQAKEYLKKERDNYGK